MQGKGKAAKKPKTPKKAQLRSELVDEQSQALTEQGAELEGDDDETAALELEAHMRATTVLIARFHAHAEQWEALEVGSEGCTSFSKTSVAAIFSCKEQCCESDSSDCVMTGLLGCRRGRHISSSCTSNDS